MELARLFLDEIVQRDFWIQFPPAVQNWRVFHAFHPRIAMAAASKGRNDFCCIRSGRYRVNCVQRG